MRYLSICSGIEAASVAWHPLGWEAAAFAEIEAFPSAVLGHHYPQTPNLGDFTRIEAVDVGHVDLLVGGTPCQSFSVAGLRGGLSDARGNLTLEFVRLADRIRPRWIVWENVPGVLNSLSHDAPEPVPPAPLLDVGRDGEVVETDDEYEADEHHAFACFISALSELGYGLAWRVVDAQYARVDGYPHAVPQRRRRVFVVGCFGDWRRASAVLLEPDGVFGDSPPRGETREGVAGTVTASAGRCSADVDDVRDGRCVAHAIKGAAIGRQPHNGPQRGDTLSDGTCYALTTNEVRAVAFGGGAAGAIDVATTATATAKAGTRLDFESETLIAFNARQDPDTFAGYVGPLDTDGGTQAVLHGLAVRRLTPTECERLQGFPDGYTDVPYRGGPAADGPRYKALGNSMAVNAMRWIGRRIALVDGIDSADRVPASTATRIVRTNQTEPENMKHEQMAQFFTSMAHAQEQQALASAALAAAFAAIFGSGVSIAPQPAVAKPADTPRPVAVSKPAETPAAIAAPAPKPAPATVAPTPAPKAAPVAPKPVTPAPKPAPTALAQAAKPDATLVREALIAVSKAHDQATGLGVLNAFGAANLGTLDPAHYDAVIARCNELVAGA